MPRAKLAKGRDDARAVAREAPFPSAATGLETDTARYERVIASIDDNAAHAPGAYQIAQPPPS